MLEISPVLAGTFDAQDYAPSNNFASGQAGDAASIDSRRYTKFDHSVTEAGEADFSFDDFLDMINPLEHVPVVSSIYREITGEKINPVARIVGDIMYGGAMGIASAVLGGLGAAGDALMEAQTGKDSAGNVVAALFGPDSSSPSTTQLASANSAAPVQAPAPAAPAPASPAPAILASSKPAPVPSASSNPASSSLSLIRPLTPQLASTTQNDLDTTTQKLLSSKTFPMDPKKLPYGGVIDPSQMQGSSNPMMASNMALAMASSAPGVPQMNHTIYAGRFANGVKPTVTSAPATAPVTNPPPPANTAGTPLPPELMQDIDTLRAINQYKSTASQSPPAGASLDVVN